MHSVRTSSSPGLLAALCVAASWFWSIQVCLAQGSTDLGGYEIEGGDVVHVEVPGEEGLTGRFTVSSDGVLQYPLVGEIKAEGKTAEDLERTITEELKGRFLKDPEVVVRLEEYRQIFVSGSVNNPGSYPFSEGLTLRKAMILAGGTAGLSGNRITIAREGGEPIETTDLEMEVEAGDVISVPEITGCVQCEEESGVDSERIEQGPPAQGFAVANSVVYPEVGLRIEHDDNIFRTNDATDSFITVLSPRVSWEGGDRLWGYRLGYQGAFGKFHSSSADDYDDHGLSAQAAAAITESSNLAFGGSLEYGHDRRGTELTEGDPEARDQPDEWRKAAVDATYFFGVDDSKFGYTIGGVYLSKEYRNNRGFTRSRDYDEARLTGSVSYALRPSLDVVGRYTRRDFDYSIDDPLDSESDIFDLGIDYEIQEYLSLSLRAGVENKEFVNTGQDVTEPSYEGVVEWRPTERHALKAGYTRSIEEAALPDDQFRVESKFYVTWAMQVTPMLTTQAIGVIGDKERDSSTLMTIEEDWYSVTAEARYQFRHWLTGVASYEYRDQDSGDDVFDYKSNIVGLSIVASF